MTKMIKHGLDIREVNKVSKICYVKLCRPFHRHSKISFLQKLLYLQLFYLKIKEVDLRIENNGIKTT